MSRKSITILGATGSIGASTLAVLAASRDFDIYALTAHQSAEELLELCLRYKPRFAVLGAEAAGQQIATSLRAQGSRTEVLVGAEALKRVASAPEVTHVMAAIVGGVGLPPTFAAVQAGKTVLLANKEALVMAGSIFMTAVERSNAKLLPVDSEHNAIFQCLGQSTTVGPSVNRILLTGSGGPFLRTPIDSLADVTPEDACRHPNWDMGRKISVDSATMMNKGLELIEAAWLFGVPADKIEFLIHPQSIVHSMVEFIDGSVVAQMGQPDMRTPIAHVLAYPDRQVSGVSGLDFAALADLSFETPDYQRFPLLGLARRVASEPLCQAVALNAANEMAVAAFLDAGLPYREIATTIEQVVSLIPRKELLCIDDVLDYDHEARSLTTELLSTDD